MGLLAGVHLLSSPVCNTKRDGNSHSFFYSYRQLFLTIDKSAYHPDPVPRHIAASAGGIPLLTEDLKLTNTIFSSGFAFQNTLFALRAQQAIRYQGQIQLDAVGIFDLPSFFLLQRDIVSYLSLQPVDDERKTHGIVGDTNGNLAEAENLFQAETIATRIEKLARVPPPHRSNVSINTS